MTSGPTNSDPTDDDGGPRVPLETRAVRSLSDRSPPDGSPEAPPREPAKPVPEPGPRLWPRVVGVGLLLVGALAVWIWQNPGFFEQTFSSLFGGSGTRETPAAKVDALEARLTQLEQREAADAGALNRRVDALEQRPAPEQTAPGQAGPDQTASDQTARDQLVRDLTALTERLDALERRGGEATAAAAGDLGPLQARMDALEARVVAIGQTPPARANSAPPADLGPLTARIDALEKLVAAQAAEPARVNAIAGKVDALETHDPAAELRGRLDEVSREVSALTQGSSKQSAAADRALRLARLQMAFIDLESGHPLGAIPDAPPALVRFANAAPPTEAELRLSFPAAEQAALKVSRPDTEGKPFFDRILARLQDFRLIVVRKDDEVVLGNAAAATLTHARALLTAGDLAGAVKAVASLSGPPAEKMAPWLADATALVLAREALAALASST
jgi:hypothetical protein